MPRATWEGVVVAESDKCVVVEGNQYFPPESLQRQYFLLNDSHTTCPWKGKASYYDLVVNGRKNGNAAWSYPDPTPAAQEIKDYVAFWKGVRVGD